MSARAMARGVTQASLRWNPRGARNSTRMRAQDQRRRIRDEARDGLSAAAVSLAGSIGVTGALWILLRWLG